VIGLGNYVIATGLPAGISWSSTPGDLVGEIYARLDRVRIHEDPALAEPVGEPIVQSSSQVTGFIATVANEDATAPTLNHGQTLYRTLGQDRRGVRYEYSGKVLNQCRPRASYSRKIQQPAQLTPTWYDLYRRLICVNDL
jgi:hypothetical protein